MTDPIHLPRITIKYCTQCKWMLRAAYFAQELLSTFGTDIGEVALIPCTGGVFTVTIYHSTSPKGDTDTDPDSEKKKKEEEEETRGQILWDRKRDGGFPEVKMLKSLVRNIIDPGRDLGHTDRALKGKGESAATAATATTATTIENSNAGNEGTGKKEECEDCK